MSNLIDNISLVRTLFIKLQGLILNLNNLQTLDDFRLFAKKKLPKMVFGYIDGGAGDGLALNRNIQSFKKLLLQPKTLINVKNRSFSKRINDQTFDYPFGIAPMGLCNVSNPNADTMLAQASKQLNIPFCVSTAASTSIEDIYKIASNNVWFQLYMGSSVESTLKLVKRVEKVGVKNLVISVDVPAPGYRPRELRDGFTAPFTFGFKQILDCAFHPSWSLPYLFYGKPKFANNEGLTNKGKKFFERNSGTRLIPDLDFLKKLRDNWPGNLYVKGITSLEDAYHSINSGCTGIYISNHGGRQLESVPSTLDLLKIIRRKIGKKYPILFDSGIRTGEDIIKAYSLGADFVFLGRPFLFASALGNKKYIIHLIKLLGKQIDSALAQVGQTSIENLNKSVLFEKDVYFYKDN